MRPSQAFCESLGGGAVAVGQRAGPSGAVVAQMRPPVVRWWGGEAGMSRGDSQTAGLNNLRLSSGQNPYQRKDIQEVHFIVLVHIRFIEKSV